MKTLEISGYDDIGAGLVFRDDAVLPFQNLAYERAKRAVTEFGDRVVFEGYNTFEGDELGKWGIVDGLYIDGKQVRTGPPPSYEKIRKQIARRVKKL